MVLYVTDSLKVSWLSLLKKKKKRKILIVRITFEVKEERAAKDKEPDSTLQLYILLMQML